MHITGIAVEQGGWGRVLVQEGPVHPTRGAQRAARSWRGPDLGSSAQRTGRLMLSVQWNREAREACPLTCVPYPGLEWAWVFPLTVSGTCLGSQQRKRRSCVVGQRSDIALRTWAIRRGPSRLGPGGLGFSLPSLPPQPAQFFPSQPSSASPRPGGPLWPRDAILRENDAIKTTIKKDKWLKTYAFAFFSDSFSQGGISWNAIF